MLRLKRQFRLAVAFSSLTMAQTSGVSGAVSGVISDMNGTPITGAQVYLIRVVIFNPPDSRGRATYVPGEGPFSVSATTNGSGSHAVAGLPAGNYMACVSVPGRPFLDPCKWSQSLGVRVDGAVTATLNAKLTLGVFLNVRINDPQHLLPTSEQTPLDFPHLIVGVKFDNEAFQAAQRVSSDSTGENYEMAIPAGVPMNLWLHSRYVTLSDAQGNALANLGAKIPFQAALGATQAFTVNVTGAVPQQ